MCIRDSAFTYTFDKDENKVYFAHSYIIPTDFMNFAKGKISKLKSCASPEKGKVFLMSHSEAVTELDSWHQGIMPVSPRGIMCLRAFLTVCLQIRLKMQG